MNEQQIYFYSCCSHHKSVTLLGSNGITSGCSSFMDMMLFLGSVGNSTILLHSTLLVEEGFLHNSRVGVNNI